MSARDRSYLYYAVLFQMKSFPLSFSTFKQFDPTLIVEVRCTNHLNVDVHVRRVGAFDKDGIDEQEWESVLVQMAAGPPGTSILCAVIPGGSKPYKILGVF